MSTQSFSVLPSELRNQIWDEALNKPRAHFIKLHRDGAPGRRYPPFDKPFLYLDSDVSEDESDNDAESTIARDPRERTRLVRAPSTDRRPGPQLDHRTAVSSSCFEAKFRAEKLARLQGVTSIPTRAGTDPNSPAAPLPVNFEEDLVCFTRGGRRDSPCFKGVNKSPRRLGVEGRFCQVFPELADLTRVAFEWQDYNIRRICQTCRVGVDEGGEDALVDCVAPTDEELRSAPRYAPWFDLDDDDVEVIDRAGVWDLLRKDLQPRTGNDGVSNPTGLSETFEALDMAAVAEDSAGGHGNWESSWIPAWCITCSSKDITLHNDVKDPDATSDTEDRDNPLWTDEEEYRASLMTNVFPPGERSLLPPIPRPDFDAWQHIENAVPCCPTCTPDPIDCYNHAALEPWESELSPLDFKWNTAGEVAARRCPRYHEVSYMSDLDCVWRYHMPKLETMYIIDRDITLKPGCRPAITTKRFEGQGGVDYFEVSNFEDLGIWEHPEGNRSEATGYVEFLEEENWRRHLEQVQREVKREAGLTGLAAQATYTTARREPIDTRRPPRVRLLACVGRGQR